MAAANQGTSDRIGPAVIKKTVVGRAVHSPHSRQPLVPVIGTGYGAALQPKVPAETISNPLQRQPPDY